MFFLLTQLPEEVQRKRHAGQSGRHVGPHDGTLDAEEPDDAGQDKQERNVVESAAQRGQEGRDARLADRLEHHVRADGHRLEERGDAEELHGAGADANDFGVIPEELDDGLRIFTIIL